MQPKLEETIHRDFITYGATGAAADADSTPTCKVFEDDNDTPILTPTVTKRTGETGNYRVPVACTSANGFEAGKSYNVVVQATVGGVAVKLALMSFMLRTRSIDDVLPTTSYTAPDNAGIVAIKAKTDALPASPAATSDIPSAATIAAAVRDVDNATPAANSLGEAVNDAGGGGGGSGTDVTLASGTVETASSATAFTATIDNLTAADGAYEADPPQFVLFQTGDLAGERRNIATHSVSSGTSSITVASGFSGTPEPGDTFVIG